MPEPTTWIVALLLGIVIILLAVNTINIRRLRREVARKQRRDDATEQQVTAILERKAVNGEPPRRPRRGLWLVPVVTGLMTAAAGLRHHVGAIGATAGAVAAITALFIAGSSTSDTRRADPPRPVMPSEAPPSPPLTTELPPPGPPSTTPSARAGARTAQPVRKPVTSLPPATVTTTVPSTTATLTTTEPTTVPPTATTSRPCLLRVQMTTLADLCVAA